MITIRNQKGRVAVVEIEGIIGVPEQWQFDEPDGRVATYETFRQRVDELTKLQSPEVVVNIRSTGGSVADALLIHDALAALPGRVTTRCYGYVASAATVIAQAAATGCRQISGSALYLIHRSVCAVEGNTEELQQTMGLLAATDQRLAAIYAARSGRAATEFEQLMNQNNGNGRWLSPQEAVDAGLADEILAVSSAVAVSAPTGRWSAVLDLLGLGRRYVGVGSRSDSGAGSGSGSTGDLLFPDEALPAPAELPADMDELSAVHNRQMEEAAAAHNRHVEQLQGRIARLEADNARIRAGATATKPKEDPSPQEWLKTPNEDAYMQDARNFK